MGLFSSGDKLAEMFAFNLLPPKTEDEINEQVNKANRNFYAMLLPIFLLLFTLFLFFLNNFVLESNKKGWQTSVSELKQELANPTTYLGSLKVRNGELKTKTDFIAEPVSKNVDFNDIFVIAERVFTGNRTASQPTSYGREEDGKFVVNAVSPQINGASEILNKFKEDGEIKDAWIENVQKDTENNRYRYVITFEILTLNEEEEVAG